MTLRTGRLISIGIVATGVVALRKANFSPRTDDAEVFANFIGIARQVDGPMTTLYVRDNQFVRKGDLLVEIDERPYRMHSSARNRREMPLRARSATSAGL